MNVVQECCIYNSGQVLPHIEHVGAHNKVIYHLFLVIFMIFRGFFAAIMDFMAAIMDFEKKKIKFWHSRSVYGA